MCFVFKLHFVDEEEMYFCLYLLVLQYCLKVNYNKG